MSRASAALKTSHVYRVVSLTASHKIFMYFVGFDKKISTKVTKSTSDKTIDV